MCRKLQQSPLPRGGSRGRTIRSPCPVKVVVGELSYSQGRHFDARDTEVKPGEAISGRSGDLESMLKKWAIEEVEPCKDQLISTIFLVEEKHLSQRLVINLKMFKFYHSLRTLQNGRVISPEGADSRRRFSLKTGLRMLILHTHRISKVPQVIYQLLCLCFGSLQDSLQNWWRFQLL